MPKLNTDYYEMLKPVIEQYEDMRDPFCIASYEEHGIEFDQLSNLIATVLRGFASQDQETQTALIVAGAMPDREKSKQAFSLTIRDSGMKAAMSLLDRLNPNQ